jgi:bifunctional oligoribonuclease and PAP phosphatase NrnA
MEENFINFEKFLSKYDKFILSTHESPDWDGLGSEIALFDLLKKLGKKPFIINSDRTPETFLFLDPERNIHVLNDSFKMPDDINEYAQFVLDTNDYSNIGAVSEFLKDKVKEYFIIDHHEGSAGITSPNFIKASASSVSEIIYHIIRHCDQPIPLPSAQALFAGIVFDTGSFVYPKTSVETFKIAAHLVELGVIPAEIHEKIYEQNTITSFELRGRILSTIEVLYGGKLIAMKLTPEMLKETGASFAEGEPAINIPLAVKGVVASLLIKQDVGGPVKVSMRTKGDLDVASIAIQNGGGGHKNAAGYKSKLSFTETYETAVKSMAHFFP